MQDSDWSRYRLMFDRMASNANGAVERNVDGRLMGTEIAQHMHGKTPVHQKPKSECFLLRNDAPALLQIDDVQYMQWYHWPKCLDDANIPFESTVQGIGPGEKRLAYLLGANVAGANASFDIITRDGRTWEVKSNNCSNGIRMATTALRMYGESRRMIERVMTLIRLFTTLAMTEPLLFSSDMKLLKRIDSFLICDLASFDAGEIGVGRLTRLWSVMHTLKNIRQWHPMQGEMSTNPPIHDIIISALHDQAFDDPTTFIDQWSGRITAQKAFGNVSGVFIVNKTSYILIPYDKLNSSFRFNRISQGRPEFEFIIPPMQDLPNHV